MGIHAIQGALFHKQGNFIRHGFSQVYKQNISNTSIDLNDVDDYNIRLFTRSDTSFE